VKSCVFTRRGVLELAVLGAGALIWLPRAGSAQATDHRHQPELELPILAEDPTAVPVRVSVAHPMEPDHFIRSIEVVLETDPVPHKGTYRFTPANGQAWVSFPMRSGLGGLVKATAECSKHGRFSGTRELRVASDGCATGADGGARDRIGNPRLRVPDAPKPGGIIEVRTKLEHDSDTGLRLRGEKYVRERPEFFVKQMRVYFDQQLISDFRLTSAVSANPIIRFPVKVSGAGSLRVVFVNSEGRQWEVNERLRPAG
jgi:desulfoferrodoxin (superoxide reductase-like protein)